MEVEIDNGVGFDFWDIIEKEVVAVGCGESLEVIAIVLVVDDRGRGAIEEFLPGIGVA